MGEIGQVIEKKGDTVIVSLQRHDACSKCGACMASIDTKEMILTATNQCNAEVGDQVNISLEHSNFIKAVLIMYCIPLVSLLVGLGIGYLISHHELIAMAVGIVFTGVTFLIIRSQESKWNQEKYRPVADRLIT